MSDVRGPTKDAEAPVDHQEDRDDCEDQSPVEEDAPKPLSRSEKFKNYLIGIGASSALILGLVTLLRGEPVAEKANKDLGKAYAILVKNQNRQAKALNRLKARLVYFQAYQEAHTAMEVQKRLEGLQKRYDTLVASQGAVKAKPAAKPAIKPVSPPVRVTRPRCSAEQRWDRLRARCVLLTRSAVMSKLLAAQKTAQHERLKRMRAERKKRALMRAMKGTKKADVPHLPAKFRGAK